MEVQEVNQGMRRTAQPLRIYRTAQCLSQRDLAAAAGVDRATIIRLEGGGHPSVKTANALAHVLGVERDALFPPLQLLTAAGTDSS